MGPPIEVNGHPRLWVKSGDLPTLRKRARSDIFSEGLMPLADDLRREMDKGSVPNEACMHASVACESYAELFAFMSLVHPDAKQRADFAKRARTLLMYVISQTAKGPKEDDPLRDPTFAVDDRSRWAGESFALTVDWIYPHLSAADKKQIRKVFLRWCKEQLTAKVTNNNHPEPIGVVRSEKLLKDKLKVRWSGNNYYAAHMRNMGLMAMALDPVDDPGGELRRYLDNATGAWLFVFDRMLRSDAYGGLGAEGLQYQSQTMSYAAQFLYALQTAGLDDEKRFGPQVVFAKNPFWKMALSAYFHIQAPAPVEIDWRGLQFPLAWYGDGQQYTGSDFIDIVAILGLAAERQGKQTELKLAQWMQKNMPPGSADGMYERMTRSSNPREAILYFLLNPDAAPSKDPRQVLPLQHFARGLGHIYARTSWKKDATWFRYILGWSSIDHQHGEGNHFGFYRDGEWLTKKRVGYSQTNLATSQFHNTLTIDNERPEHDDPGDYRYTLWKRGSQWTAGTASGDGKILAHSLEPSYVYALGDSTQLYNSDYEGVRGTKLAARSIIWIKPDVIVTFDRAETKDSESKKRYWLQLPTPARVFGNHATMTTKKGQQLFVTSLIPKTSKMVSAKSEPLEDEIAGHEPMDAYLMIEPSAPSKYVEFLTVLEGADKGKAGLKPTLLVDNKQVVATAVGKNVVVFAKSLTPVDSLSFPPGPKGSRYYIAGLSPNKAYNLALSGGTFQVAKARSGQNSTTSNSGGVITVSQ